jgi:stress-induced morphogen
MTASLDRSGNGGMLAALKLFDGTSGAPGLSWSTETTSGLYRAGAGDFRWNIAATEVLKINTNLFQYSGTGPVFRFNETDAAANNKLWDVLVSGEQMAFRVINDALSVSTVWMTIDRTGTVVDSVALTATTLALNGAVTTTGDITQTSIQPNFYMVESDAAANNKRWRFVVSSEQFQGIIQNDAQSVDTAWIMVDRTGTTVDTVTWSAGSHVWTVAGLNSAPNILLSNTLPVFVMNETDAAADNRRWVMLVNTEQLRWSLLNDANSIQTDFLAVDRTGTVVDSITLSATALLTNANITQTSTQPNFYMVESDAAANNQRWRFVVSSEQFQGIIQNDAQSVDTTWLAVDRTGTTVDVVNISTPLLQAQGIHNGTAPTGTNNYIASGTYTPTFTNTTNVTGMTGAAHQWMRVGNVVTVSGQASGSSSAGGAIAFDVSLPIASALTATGQLNGAAGAIGGTGIAADRAGQVYANAVNDRMQCASLASAAGTIGFTYTFTYVVL